MTRLDACRGCRFAVVHMDGQTRCHKNEPVTIRGSDRAVWPVVNPDQPGGGRFREPEEARPA